MSKTDKQKKELRDCEIIANKTQKRERGTRADPGCPSRDPKD
jgi:hypothetical protein